MKCAVHSDVDATGYCRNCGKAMCAACARPVRDVLYCEDCLATVMGHPPAPAAAAPSQPVGTPSPQASTQPYPTPMGAPYQQQRGRYSPAAAFWLGLFPGLGAIYNGQYNKGLIQIAIFASIIVGFNSDLGGGMDAMLAIFLAGFVFYCAFEAMRTAQAKNAGETPTDPLETWSTSRPIGPIILIALGGLLLLNNFHALEFFRLGRLWPLIMIGAGLYMFRNKIGGRNL
jgi:Domain of unknown function (DUF5668)